MNEETLVYRIDGADVIVGVGDNWSRFAEENAGPGGRWRPEEVVGRPLWNFIQGEETRQFYQEIFRRVREGRRCRPLPFRCDSPAERRFLDLVLDEEAGGCITIVSRTLHTERRPALRMLEAGAPRSRDRVTICSMCKKIKVTPERWVEIEEGLVLLRLFEADAMPWLSHGLCPACYRTAMQELEAN